MATVTAVLPKKPLFIQAAGGDTEIPYDALAFRTLTGALWPRTGIVSDTAFLIQQRAAGANFSVDIHPGYAVLGDATGTEFDRYVVYSTAIINISLATFVINPAATRTHKVWLAVFDKQRTSLGTQYDGKVIITEDVGAGAPLPSDAGIAYTHQIGTISIAPAAASVTNANLTNSSRHAQFGSSYLNVPISANISDAVGTTSLGTPRAIRTGTTVKLCGGFVRTSGAAFTANTTYILGQLPPHYRPVVDRFLVAPASAAGPAHATYRLTVRTTGNLEALTANDWAPPWLGVDGCTYELD